MEGVTMKLNPKYFNTIKNGSKKIEGRLYDEKRRQMFRDENMFKDNVNTVTFICTKTDQKLTKKILKYHIFDSFLSASQKYYQDMIPWAQSYEEVVNVYNGIYTHEDQFKYGVILIELE